jgi:putative transposase
LVGAAECGGRTRRTIPLALRPGRKRALVDALRSKWAISVRRACAAIRFDPKTYRYKSRPGQAALEQRIKENCPTRIRFGYRRVHVLLRREGWEINPKRTYRIYEDLQDL